MNAPASSADIQTQIGEARVRLSRLRDEEKALDARRKEIATEILALVGHAYAHGQIGMLEDAHKRALEAEADEKRPSVLCMAKWGGGPYELLVTRVTPRRIYMHQRGGRDVYVDRFTGVGPMYAIIDFRKEAFV